MALAYLLNLNIFLQIFNSFLLYCDWTYYAGFAT